VEAANESVNPPEPPALPPSPPRRSAWRGLIAWLLVLAALGAGGWYGWQWLQRDLALRAERDAQIDRLIDESRQLRAQVDRLAKVQDAQSAADGRIAGDVAALNARVEETAAAAARIAETIQGGRMRVQLSAIEQVLLMANDRALLARDAAGAADALAQADARIAALNEPRLFPVREAIAKERAALATVPRLDITAAALSLSSLVEGLPRLPLQGQLPGRLEASTQLSSPPPEGSWWSRLWVSLRQALRAVFIVRRDEGVSRLLPPEQQTLVIHIGLLKLEGARLALMRGNTAAFREMCAAASGWLRDYFDPEAPGVGAAKQELERLKALDLAPVLPDISGSLELLRKQMSAP
jgi:uncharacterized protein HemX